MHCNCQSIVHRALVTYSNASTGEIKVKIPSVIGTSAEVSISYIGRSSTNGYWAVPDIGEQIIVSSDDSNLNNVFWLQVEPYNSLGISSETGEPMGFANRLDSVISFDNATRVFTISPVDGSYDVWVRGVLYTITSPMSITLPTGHGGYNIYFDTTGTLQVKTAFFELEYEAPVSFIYWNTVSAIMFSDERHGITLDWATHEYLHRTRGAAIANGFEVSGYTTTGTGNTVADAKITIANGTFFDEDLQIDITHSATPVVNTWQQRLQSGAYIPVYYKDSAGWQKTTATQYPLKFGTTYPQYNLNASSLVQMDNNRYGIAWILATNGLNEPVISVMGQEQYSNIGDAHTALWSNVVMTGFPSFEFRPLWKVIFQAQNGSAIKAAIRQLDDLRTFQGTAASGGTSVSSLDGLVDVTLTSPTSGEILSYNGSQWVNNSSLLSAKAPINNPTFTGTVSGITKSMVGLSNVDNTSDTGKPVSTAQQTALNAKANLSGATFTGGVTVTNGYFDGGWGITCGGGVSLGGATAVNNFKNYRALQISTTTAWGGIYDDHSGYLINAQMPSGWTSAVLQFRASSDWGTYNGGIISFQYGNVYGNGWSMSDARTKINVVDNPYGLEIIRQMIPRRFGYRMSDGSVNEHVSLTNQKVGFIAQELMEVLPDAVFHREHEEENEHGYSAAYSVDYGSLTAVLTKAIQELDERLTALEESP